MGSDFWGRHIQDLGECRSFLSAHVKPWRQGLNISWSHGDKSMPFSYKVCALSSAQIQTHSDTVPGFRKNMSLWHVSVWLRVNLTWPTGTCIYLVTRCGTCSTCIVRYTAGGGVTLGGGRIVLCLSVQVWIVLQPSASALSTKRENKKW